MSKYVDGFVIPVPKDKIEQYREMAAKASVIWKEDGALQYRDAVGDDLEVQDQISLPTLANAAPEETVILAYIVYEAREHRDAVNAKVMADPRIQGMCKPDNPPF